MVILVYHDCEVLQTSDPLVPHILARNRKISFQRIAAVLLEFYRLVETKKLQYFENHIC